MKKKASKPSEPEIMSFEVTPLVKKTAKKSPTVKRPTDLSSIQKQGSRLGKKMPFGNSKPRKKKTGPTRWRFRLPSISRPSARVTSTTVRPQFLMSSSEAKSFKTTTTSPLTNSTSITVGLPSKTRGLKYWWKKFDFYIIFIILLGCAFRVAQEFCDNWFSWGAFYLAVYLAVRYVLGSKS